MTAQQRRRAAARKVWAREDRAWVRQVRGLPGEIGAVRYALANLECPKAGLRHALAYMHGERRALRQSVQDVAAQLGGIKVSS